MNRTLFTLTAGALAASAAASPVAAGEIQIQSSGPIVELTISESVKAEPDIATISAGVTSEATTAVEAMQINANEMTAVIARIKALGIDEKDIQTSGISLNPRYDYDRDSQQQIFRGYSVSNRVSVILRKIERTGPVLDALVAAGATDIGGPSFSVNDDTTAKAQARAAAMKTARERAMEYAGWAGYGDIRLLEVSEFVASSGPEPMLRTMAKMDAGSGASTPVQPGLIGTGVTVTVKYEMVK
ncbi:MAG: SIMPL domain-containing protein [Pontixanthobacter sp.]